MTKTPNEIAKELRDEANELLFDQDLNEVILNYGCNCFIGSYDLDLMAWPIIEYILILDSEDVFDMKELSYLGEVIIKFYNASDMQLIDYTSPRESMQKKGLYCGLNIPRKNNKKPWEFNIWALDDEGFDDEIGNMEDLRKEINNETREIILNIKHTILKQEGTLSPAKENLIHRAVLLEKIYKSETIMKYIKEQK